MSNNPHTLKFTSAAILGLALGVVSVARATYSPVPLTAGSYTYDIVIEKTAPPPLGNFTTVTMDYGTNNFAYTFYESGFEPGMPWTGLPHPGAMFTSQADPNHSFQMPPSYTTNNVAFIGARNIPNTSTLEVQVASATLTLDTPATYTGLSILYGASLSGTPSVTVRVHHADSSAEDLSFSPVDWFNGSTGAYIARGRVNISGSSPWSSLNTTTGTKLFSADVFLGNTTSPVTSVEFLYTSGDYRCLVFAISGSNDNTTFAPIPVSGFNGDAVVEASAPTPAMGGYNVTMEQGTNSYSWNFYEQGFDGQTTTGLPHPGNTIVNGNHTFQMPPTYVGNCGIFLVTNSPYLSGTATLSTSAPYNGLSFLCSAAGSASGVNIAATIHFSDGGSQTANLNFGDWFGSATDQAYLTGGRISVHDGNLGLVGNGAKLWQRDVGLTNPNNVTSIDFATASGNRAVLFAISGQTTSGGDFQPVAFSGFNADMVVEATQVRYPAGLFSATTATMDLGTNNANWTWSEQGWQSNGYPAKCGLPAAGSTLTSVSDSARQYIMPSTYAGPNAVLIDTNHQVANITPVSAPTAYAVSLLTAGASIGGGTMTNVCILQHADGTSQTNLFYGYDWFNGTIPPAFISNGRADTRFRTVTDIASGNPKLFETRFPVVNNASPITNIVVKYQLAGGANWTTYVMALSASATPVEPIFAIPTPSLRVWEGTNFAISIPTGGGEPISYQWQYSADGTAWTDLTDGAIISGATSSALTFTGISWTNTGSYRLIAWNSAGYSTNVPGTITAYSGVPSVTQPGDPISAYNPNGGSFPGGEAPPYAIDRTTSKYLNFGTGTTYTGPLGFIVTPSLRFTTISAVRFYTANDSSGRDPASYTIEGSDDGSTWTTIVSNSLALPDGRNNYSPAAAINPLTQNVQEVHFANSTGYLTYRVAFPTVKDMNQALMQIGEVELLGIQTPFPPQIVEQPSPNLNVYAGASPLLRVNAWGVPTNLFYQWYLNGSTAIAGATSSTYRLPAVSAADTGKSYTCTITNSVGSTNTVAAVLNVLAAPIQPYPLAVLGNSPVGFWRLDEGPDDGMGNNGVVAYDRASGNNGSYSNALLGVSGYNTNSDPDTALQVGFLASMDSYAGNIHDVDFGTPTNSNGAFSIEAWALGGAQSVDAGIVAKGPGGGGEQFCLDTGAGGEAHNFRFYVRDAASGNAHGANGTVAPDNEWHHLVGVVDQANSNVVLYIDGISNASATITADSGILSSTWPISIGSRTQNANTNYNNQFFGVVDEVAAYDFALSPAQVLNHYYAAQLPPRISLQPTNTTVSEATTATFYSGAYGPPTLGLQWYQSTDGINFLPMAGQTSPNLVLANVPLSYNNYFYQMVATNNYGSVTSAVAMLTVYSGAPQLLVDLPNSELVYAGRPLTLSVTIGGTAPFSYRWQKDGVDLVDDGRITGSDSNVLSLAYTLPADAGNYQVFVTNNLGSANSAMCALTVQTRPAFNTNGFGWALNNGATIDNNVLALTVGAGNTVRSAFYQFPLYVGAFYASFTYQDVGGGGADGMAFVLHNDPRGTTALGGGGGSLGVSGITPSAELEFNIYANATPGIAYHTNGATGGYSSTSPVDISSGDPIDVTVLYASGVATVTLSNTLLGQTFTAALPVGDLTIAAGGETAYVGFTGADGGTPSTQNVSNFLFLPLPVLTAQPAGANVVLSWPASIGGYKLQSRASLSSGSWQDLNVPIVQNGDSNQATVSIGSGQFYRLVLP